MSRPKDNPALNGVLFVCPCGKEQIFPQGEWVEAGPAEHWDRVCGNCFLQRMAQKKGLRLVMGEKK